MFKVKVFNQFQAPVAKCSPTGTKYDIYLEEVVDEKTGEIKRKEKRVPRYAMIQAQKKTTDMAYILSRLEAGDLSVLEKTNGVYMDTTELPGSLEEAVLFDEKMESVFKNNKLLQGVYKDFDSYKKDIIGGVDVAKKVVDFSNKMIADYKVKSAEVKKPEVKPEVKETK